MLSLCLEPAINPKTPRTKAWGCLSGMSECLWHIPGLPVGIAPVRRQHITDNTVSTWVVIHAAEVDATAQKIARGLAHLLVVGGLVQIDSARPMLSR